jgi:hypothetical protein
MTQYQTPAQPKSATQGQDKSRISPEYSELLHMLAALDGGKSTPSASKG